MKNSPASTPSGVKRLQEKSASRKSPHRLSNGALILIILGVFFTGLILSGLAQGLLRKIYDPMAFVLLVLLFVEYILLKGRDRSRIYRLELDQLHEKRRADLRDIRQWESQLGEIEGLFAGRDGDCGDGASQKALEKIRQLKQNIGSKL